MEEVIDLKEIIEILKKNLKLILGLAILFALIAGLEWKIYRKVL